MSLLLRNLRLWSEGSERGVDLRLGKGRVEEIGRGIRPGKAEVVLDLSGFAAFPGLINSHDHLQHNLLPHLGTPPYENFSEVAPEIYRPDSSPLKEISTVRPRHRLLWGGVKSLIGGATTVVHHDPFVWPRWLRRFPVKVHTTGWSHSLAFSKDLVADFRAARGGTFVVHAAEGVDARAGREIDELDELGVLGPSTVLVHCMAADERQLSRLAKVGAGVVWCPGSNLRLYGETAKIPAMMGSITVALGTDSTISGEATLFDEIRVASETGLVSSECLLDMVTTDAARLFRLTDGRGTLRVGAAADLLVLPDSHSRAAENLVRARPAQIEMILVDGQPMLLSPGLAAQLSPGAANGRVAGAAKWFFADIPSLRRRTERRAGEALLTSPLWNLVRSLESTVVQRAS